MKRLLLLVLLLLQFSFFAHATHIVGGELEMIHVGSPTVNSYRVSLIMYFDAVNGDPGAINDNVEVFVYSKATNDLMQRIRLPLVSDNLVPYTQPSCAVGSLVTRRIYYTRIVEFEDFVYNQAQGYYMVWERCCRNGVVNNIIAPGAAGQVFYLEFPSIMKSGTRFLNSSPRLFPPLSDYACVNQPFSFNFSGSDPDGDQLVYRLATPLNGYSSTSSPAPAPSPAPYPLVNFVPGISLANMIPGSPPLSISSTGIITLKASAPGLYVFAVAVDEYRAGVKIGEVRREYQLMVLNCPVANPPSVQFKADVSPDFYVEGTTITLNPSDSRCGKLYISDPDFGSQVTAIAQPLNFGGGVTITPSTTTTSGIVPAVMTVCFPDCPLANGDPYIVNLIVRDNSCAVPLMDTVQVKVKILTTPNDKPVVTTNITPTPTGDECYRKNVNIGETVSFDVFGNDANADTLSLTAVGDGFNMTAIGMVFNGLTGVPTLKQKFTWTPKCTDIPDGLTEKEYKVFFYVKDKRKCDRNQMDTTCVIFKLTARPNDNLAPVITGFLPRRADSLYLDTAYVGDIVSFDLAISDPNKDSVALSYEGVNFVPFEPNITLTPTLAKANYRAKFTWKTRCEDLKDITKPQNFIIRFRAVDLDLCKRKGLEDTIRVMVTLLPPKNEKPVISTTLSYDAVNKIYYDTLEVGETALFDVKGVDPDGDSIVVSGNGTGYAFSTYNMLFSTKGGMGTVVSPFKWLTKCEYLTDVTKSKNFFMQFKVVDIKGCNNQKLDTVSVRLTLIPPKKRNSAPILSIPGMTYNTVLEQYEDTVFVGDLEKFDVVAKDAEFDSLEIRGFGDGFNFADYDMIFSDVRGRAPLTAPFSWQTLCKHLGAITPGAQVDFYLIFTAREFKSCQKEFLDSIKVKLTLKYAPQPPNAPELTASLAFDAIEKVYFIKAKANDLVKFDVIGKDKDNSTINIISNGEGFTLSSLGMTFPQPLVGKPTLKGEFTWKTNCSLLGSNFSDKSYYVTFIAEDANNCLIRLADTIRVRIDLSADPNNSPPTIVADGIAYDAAEGAYKVTINVNQTIGFDLVADDVDKNEITLSGAGVGFDFASLDMSFETKVGLPILRSSYKWTPTCSMMGGAKEKMFEMNFIASDITPCGKRSSTPAKVKILVKDFAQVPDFLPPNVFTPNSDGKNDAFTMPALPLNTCEDQFESIKIYNRWDKLVYESTDRNFAWEATNFPSGVYYYLLRFSRKDFKGTVTLMGK